MKISLWLDIESIYSGIYEACKLGKAQTTVQQHYEGSYFEIFCSNAIRSSGKKIIPYSENIRTRRILEKANQITGMRD